MFMAAAKALAAMSPARYDPASNLLPPVTALREVSIAVARAIALQARKEGLTDLAEDEIDAAIHAKMWSPKYLPYRRTRGAPMTDRSRHPIVHFVGSVPLPDSETVFRTLSKAVGPHLIRLPDGETGIRKSWIRFLQDVLSGNSADRVRHRRAAVQVRAMGRQGGA